MAQAMTPLTAAPAISTNTPPVRGEINRYDATSGNLSVTLPELSGSMPGERFTIQKSTQDTSANTVTVTAAGADVFDDGATAFILRFPGDFRDVKVVSVTGVKKWRAIGGNLLTGVTDRNGNNIVSLPAQASAVNHVEIKNAATTAAPAISAIGSDTNIDLNLVPKGTGLVKANGVALRSITPRINSVTSSATPSINVDTTDQFNITALAVAITSMSSGLSGTAVDGQKLMVRIKDDGTGRAITWGASWRGIGVTLPTTTVATKTLYVGAVYNSAATIWDAVAVGQQA
jgi:hypothetical protein